MKKLIINCSIFALAISFGAQTLSSAEKTAPAKVKWHNDLRKAHEASVASNKPILIVFGAKWCGYCKVLEQKTLSDSRMVKYVNAEFTPLHLDFDKDRKIAKVLEVESVPCTVILSPQADLLGKVVGYVDTAKYQKTLDAARKLQKEIQQVSSPAK
jgi:thioredoxin-related protein